MLRVQRDFKRPKTLKMRAWDRIEVEWDTKLTVLTNLLALRHRGSVRVIFDFLNPESPNLR